MTKPIITIPTQHYVGMVLRHDSKLPLGFITPNGMDAPSKKRMATVDGWVKNNKSQLPTTVIDNKPMIGFKLTGSIRNGDKRVNDHWRIEDPRGFELEISSSNLADLLKVATIEKYEILDECVWCRLNGGNFLLSTESDYYKEAVGLTKAINSKAKWKDVKPGYGVVVNNGIKGIYLGKYYFIIPDVDDSSEPVSNKIQCTNKILHSFLIELDDISIKKYSIKTLASPNLAAITDNSNELTSEEAELKINEYLHNKDIMFDSVSYHKSYGAAANPIVQNSWTLKLDEIPIDTYFLNSIPSYGIQKFVRLKNGKLGHVNKDSFGRVKNQNLFSFSEIDENLFKQNILANIKTLKNKQNRYIYSSYSSNTPSNFWEKVELDIDKNDFDKGYILSIEYNTELGNKITYIFED